MDSKSLLESKQRYMELAVEYSNKNDNENAINCYQKILEIDPDCVITLNNIGCCWRNLLQLDKAISFFKRGVAIYPVSDIHNNLGSCYTNLRQYPLAEKHYFDALQLDSTSRKAYFGLGNLYFYQKKYDKSIEFYNHVVRLEPQHLSTLHNLSFPYLAKKEFKKGLELYENRLLIESGNRLEIADLDLWNGKDKCQRLLVLAEQGLGDNIQYYRFVLELAKLHPDMNITFFSKKELGHLYKSYRNIDVLTVVRTDKATFAKSFDFKIYLMSLPKILNVTNITPYPVQKSYIVPDEDKVLYWKKKFSSLKKFKIGIVWRGLLDSFINKNIPLSLFQSISELDVELICIHKKGECQKDVDSVDFGHKLHCYSIDEIRPFEDTVAILSNIDLLLTVDTVIVHLAGVLGVRTWLLLGYCSDWRWFSGSTTPWYETVELFRMKEINEWAPVLERVKNELCQRFDVASREKSLLIPVSVGELFDKYSILEIKLDKIKDKEKQKDVQREIRYLKPFINNYGADNEAISELRNVNSQLWDIENHIRRKEAKQEFDNEFIEIARSVYQVNDKRASIKRRVNASMSSAITEVKEYESY